MTLRCAVICVLLFGANPANATEPLERLVVTGGEDAPTPLGERITPPAVLHFWATWCTPCLRELPEIARLKAEQPELFEGVTLISVDTAGYARVEAFLADRLDLPGLPTLKVVEGNAGTLFGIRGYPSTIFVAPDGSIDRIEAGVLDWGAPKLRAEVEAHLSDPQ